MKKYFITFAIGIVILVLGIFLWSKKQTSVGKTTIGLSCDRGYEMTATYDTPDQKGILTRLLLTVYKDGNTHIYEMTPAMSASGSRFATRDQIYTFWEHQGEFTFAIRDTNEAVCREMVK
jgi:membrane-bound inhibitor of C-type lysozyme